MFDKNVHFIIGIGIFTFANLFNIRDAVSVQIILLIYFLVIMFFDKEIDPSTVLPFLLSMDTRTLLLSAGIIAIRAFSDQRLLQRNGFFAFILSGIILLMESAFVGGIINYNLARLITIISPILLISCLSTKCNSRLGRDRNIIIIYIISVILSVICKHWYFPNDRLSIFDGTENIAFFIIAILLILAVSHSKKPLVSAGILTLYMLYALTLQSRTAAIMGVVVAIYLFREKTNKTVFLLGGTIGAYAFTTLFFFDKNPGDALIQAKYILEYARPGNFLSVLSAVDIRGYIYFDGIRLISNSPFFGNGAVQPSIFSIQVFGLQEFHNGILDILVTFGFAGLICYLFIFRFGVSMLPRKGSVVYFMLFFLAAVAMVQPIIFNLQAVLVFFSSLFLLSTRLDVNRFGGV